MTHYSRHETGLRPAEGRYRLSKLLVRGVALHWPAMAQPLDTVAEVMAALRSWQAYHMDVRGWSDIAYQLAVDQQGNTYGLRGMRYRSAANGGTVVNRTHGAFLLVVAPGEQPSEAMAAKVRQLVAEQQALFPLARRVVGHKDVRPEPTACPGPAVSRLITVGAFDPRKATK